MERVHALINILHEQSLQNADAGSLLLTVQMLQAELAKITAGDRSRRSGTSKVAVVMPATNGHAVQSAAVPDTAANPDIFAGALNAYLGKINGTGHHDEPVAPAPVQPEFDPLKEIPTLAHQEQAKEINDVIGQGGASLNDKLKILRTEVAEALTETPIRDLKRAIGINDRYVFVNELFRGDDAMYERSIKTINGFRILPEAEYWIDRELKVKLGWDDGKTITQHFYQLIRRRFS